MAHVRRSRMRSAVGITVAVTCLLCGLFGVKRVWPHKDDRQVRVRVTLSTDDGEEAVLLSRRHPFDGETVGPAATVDLSRWKGQLVRLEITGGVWSERHGTREGVLACKAQIADPDEISTLEFVGIDSFDKRRTGFHAARIGSPSWIAPGRARAGMVYSDTILWHALYVPDDAVLHLTYAPVLNEHLAAVPRRYLPKEPAPRTPTARVSRPARPRPDIFIYVIDALRRDHLGCYGYERPTSPSIDAFASQATLFLGARAASSWTRPSMTSMLTGLYVSTHGVISRDSGKLGDWPLLLSEALKSGGYTTCHLAANVNLAADWGFDQGVDVFHFANLEPADLLVARLDRFLATQPPDQPVYAYVHTMEVHAPHAPPARLLRRFDRGLGGTCDGSVAALENAGQFRPNLSAADLGTLVDRYDACIAEADEAFSRFLQVLEHRGRLADAMVIVLADHGESFAEHGYMGHGLTLYPEEIRVPLVIRFPAGQFEAQRIKARVSLVDIFPTVIAQTGVTVELPYRLPGRDLAAVVTTPPAAPRRIYAETYLDGGYACLVSVTDRAGYKRVIETSGRRPQPLFSQAEGLWYTKSDPEHSKDLSQSRPVRAAFDEQLIARWIVRQRQRRGATAASMTSPMTLSPDLKRHLRSLGYLK